MRVLLVFSVVIAASYGVGVKWTDLRGGNVELPTTKDDALDASWVSCEEDNTLKITWYKKHSYDTFAIAFDKRGNCAGVQITVLKSSIQSEYLKLYQKSGGIFEKTKLNGYEAYKSIALFTDPSILKSGGRQMQKGEEIALGVYLKANGKYTRLSREGCVIAKTYNEQSCQSTYGLVFSAFEKKSKCTTLTPFYTVYDPEYDGDLTGFGWLSFHEVSSTESFKSVSADYVKTLFPHSPSCLTSCSSAAVMTVWLSYSDSQEASCSGTNWVSSRCQEKVSTKSKKSKKSKKSSSSSSSSSDSSDSDSSD